MYERYGMKRYENMYEIGWMNPIRPLTTLLYLSYLFSFFYLVP